MSLFYISLTIPLPFLAKFTQTNIAPELLWITIAMGFMVLQGALSEQVIVDGEKIMVTYPRWINWLFRRTWTLQWSEIKALKMRTTGQGGLVYYFISHNQQGFLLPMRIAGFNRLVANVQARTGIDTTDIHPLSQPWMYIFLMVLTIFLLLIDLWTINTAVYGNLISN